MCLKSALALLSALVWLVPKSGLRRKSRTPSYLFSTSDLVHMVGAFHFPLCFVSQEVYYIKMRTYWYGDQHGRRACRFLQNGNMGSLFFVLVESTIAYAQLEEVWISFKINKCGVFF